MSRTDPAPRPWWASEEDDQAVPAADPDPLTRHRAARRGEAATGDGHPTDDGTWWAPAAEAVARLSRELAATATANAGEATAAAGSQDDGPDQPGPRGGGDDGSGGHHIDTCGVCPICVGLRALGEARPDLLVHLSEAARHVAMAVRAVVDAAAEAPADAAEPQARAGEGFTRIDLDDEGPAEERP